MGVDVFFGDCVGDEYYVFFVMGDEGVFVGDVGDVEFEYVGWGGSYFLRIWWCICVFVLFLFCLFVLCCFVRWGLSFLWCYWMLMRMLLLWLLSRSVELCWCWLSWCCCLCG